MRISDVTDGRATKRRPEVKQKKKKIGRRCAAKKGAVSNLCGEKRVIKLCNAIASSVKYRLIMININNLSTSKRETRCGGEPSREYLKAYVAETHLLARESHDYEAVMSQCESSIIDIIPKTGTLVPDVKRGIFLVRLSMPSNEIIPAMRERLTCG